MGMIFHIVQRTDWDAAVGLGRYEPTSLRAEGFIHCSTIGQTIDTANLFFRGQQGLVLLCIDSEKLTAPLRFEPPTAKGHDDRVEALFPHIYGPLDVDAVTRVVNLPCGGDGSFALPDELLASV